MNKRDVVSRSILTKATGFLASGYTHSLNPYAGCAFSCKFCYVRELPIQRFKEMEWGTWLELKVNAAEVYQKEIQKLRKKEQSVRIFMSSATDPYQPAERKAGITRALLETMINHPPDFLLIQTRSPLVTRDIDLLLQLQKVCDLRVSMTVETDREDVKQIFSPYAPGMKLRMNALKKVKESGISTQVTIAPMLPFTPEFPEKIEGMMNRICIDTLYLGDGSLGKTSKRLGMPELFEKYGFLDWYDKDIHVKAIRYFEKFYPSSMIYLSQEGFAP
ncbi:radical SAM protein [Bacillus megaterium]|nr:radical SAM protein [Priestia megaterium]